MTDTMGGRGEVQSDVLIAPSGVSRFRPQYRALTEAERLLHDEIKTKAAELEALFNRVGSGWYGSLAMTSLEQSVMWAVKELTK